MRSVRVIRGFRAKEKQREREEKKTACSCCGSTVGRRKKKHYQKGPINFTACARRRRLIWNKRAFDKRPRALRRTFYAILYSVCTRFVWNAGCTTAFFLPIGFHWSPKGLARRHRSLAHLTRSLASVQYVIYRRNERPRFLR